MVDEVREAVGGRKNAHQAMCGNSIKENKW